MNTNTVCIFPNTMPGAEILFPLVQAFGPIVYLRPVENDLPVGPDQPPLVRELIEQRRVDFVCPAPLVENRDRFLQLVDDLQHRRDDYAGQLSHLSLAGLGSERKRETKTSIIGTLLKQTGIADAEKEQRAMILWQARLILKLAESFDREQEELQKNLERISARENGLIEELREENKQPFSLTRSLSGGKGQTEAQLRLRLKAWSRLFGLGSKAIPATTFITASRDSFELLAEQYELSQNKAPELILKLQLAVGSTSNAFAEKLAAFTDDAAEMIDTLQTLLEDPGAADKKGQTVLNGPDSRWAELLEKHYPAEVNGRCSLSLYSLPGINPADFFLESFGRDEDEGLKQEKSSEKTGAVIGILTQQTDS